MSELERQPTTSVPVMSADGHIGFEGTDAPAKIVVVSLLIVAALATAGFVLMFGFDKMLEAENPKSALLSPLAPERVVPPAPQLEQLPWLDLPQMRAHEDSVLGMSGKDDKGRNHIPIDKAMDLVPSRLTFAQNAPAGITTPGGQGATFSHGLADMPPAYQHSQVAIQGEIQKNAK